jgi:hypothetical protein
MAVEAAALGEVELGEAPAGHHRGLRQHEKAHSLQQVVRPPALRRLYRLFVELLQRLVRVEGIDLGDVQR